MPLNPRLSPSLALAALLLVAVGAPGDARAEAGDRNQPMNAEADALPVALSLAHRDGVNRDEGETSDGRADSAHEGDGRKRGFVTVPAHVR